MGDKAFQSGNHGTFAKPRAYLFTNCLEKDALHAPSPVDLKAYVTSAQLVMLLEGIA
ncbi:hypothetical protein [Terasakiella pusilla]|uniref:hypothetical protein n=1 Tax=Terasakiella pusilla TaxID=64973 RepID=UPI00146FC1DC|nr:hypothetical protein [Terasakiella pusilla]